MWRGTFPMTDLNELSERTNRREVCQKRNASLLEDSAACDIMPRVARMARGTKAKNGRAKSAYAPRWIAGLFFFAEPGFAGAAFTGLVFRRALVCLGMAGRLTVAVVSLGIGRDCSLRAYNAAVGAP
jgi:hypothetical protein